MTVQNNNERIEKYCAKIESIHEGNRNSSLYKIGLCFRSNFGLQGNTLTEWLLHVNQTKCSPPLSKHDVVRIAQSVDSSNIPLGDGGRKQEAGRQAVGGRKQVAVADILKKDISVYPNCYSNKPSTSASIGFILDGVRDGLIKDQAIKIRAIDDKEKRNELKKHIPAVVFGSETQALRRVDQCTPNGVLCLDFDNIPPDELVSAKIAIADVPYVFAVALSVSGRGLFALVCYEGTPNLKELLTSMQADFQYPLDTSCSDISRLRFVTYDPDIIIKDKVFPAVRQEAGELSTLCAIRTKSATGTGVDVLDSILAKIEPVDWSPYCTKDKPPSERNHLLRTCERILETATTVGCPIVVRHKTIYCYTGTHYRAIEESELQNFLIEATMRCGVPNDTAIYLSFVDKLTQQFYINAGRIANVTEPVTTFINLRNGTLFFDKSGHKFKKHTPKHFIRYTLNFDYDEKATATRWQQHLDRSLPHHDKQTYLAKCLALPFYKGKIEKAPIFYGRRDTGKSTTLDVYKALVGAENISTETLVALTTPQYQGEYARARLDGKLVNIASDISKKISDEGLMKTLISREAVSARHPYGKGFNMMNYARLIFAMNELPPQFFGDAALTKRVAIIEFDQQVTSQVKDTDFAEKIIANELPGVLNWIIDGLTRLNTTGQLNAPPCCVEAMEKIRQENDPLAGWLAEKRYGVGELSSIAVKDAYESFTECCKENGNTAPSKKTFTRRLRDAGYKIDRPNHEGGMMLYYTNSFLKNGADGADGAEPLEF